MMKNAKIHNEDKRNYQLGVFIPNKHKHAMK